MEFVSEIIIRENFIIEYGSHIRDALLIILEGQISFHVNGTTYIADENDICIFQIVKQSFKLRHFRIRPKPAGGEGCGDFMPCFGVCVRVFGVEIPRGMDPDFCASDIFQLRGNGTPEKVKVIIGKPRIFGE